MTLCERCEHQKVCEIRSVQDEDDERALVECSNFFEVVSCKDCRHRYEPFNCALWYGTHNGNEHFIERGDDFYCSFGERKEGVD